MDSKTQHLICVSYRVWGM